MPCHLLKLSLVGYQMAGKSSLLDAMVACNVVGRGAPPSRFAPLLLPGRNAADRTDGIDIKWWKPRKGHPLQLCAWDYAGQEEYLATHQFFLSSRSLHLLVFDLSNMQLPRLVAWVESLQSRAPGSKLILVGSHLDECEGKGVNAAAVMEQAKDKIEEWDQEQKRRLQHAISTLQREDKQHRKAHTEEGERQKQLASLENKLKEGNRPQILASVAVSCTEGGGVREILDAIVEATSSFELYGKEVPAKYMRLVGVLKRQQQLKALAAALQKTKKQKEQASSEQKRTEAAAAYDVAKQAYETFAAA